MAQHNPARRILLNEDIPAPDTWYSGVLDVFLVMDNRNDQRAAIECDLSPKNQSGLHR